MSFTPLCCHRGFFRRPFDARIDAACLYRLAMSPRPTADDAHQLFQLPRFHFQPALFSSVFFIAEAQPYSFAFDAFSPGHTPFTLPPRFRFSFFFELSISNGHFSLSSFSRGSADITALSFSCFSPCRRLFSSLIF
jgi:hypothetical protein